MSRSHPARFCHCVYLLHVFVATIPGLALVVRTTVIEYTSAPLRRRNRTYDGITQRAAGRSRRQSSAKRRKNKANRKKYILTQPMCIGTECGRLANIQKTSMERKRERKKNWLHTIHDECPWLTHTRKKAYILYWFTSRFYDGMYVYLCVAGVSAISIVVGLHRPHHAHFARPTSTTAGRRQTTPALLNIPFFFSICFVITDCLLSLPIRFIFYSHHSVFSRLRRPLATAIHSRQLQNNAPAP